MKSLRLAVIFLAGGIFVLFSISFLIPPKKIFIYHMASTLSFWPVQSIDTMKYSRDLSREMMNNSDFDKIIDEQIGNIAATGATHVAIATPYDKEFIPMLERWVGAARKYKLKVWFRGNFSGWEKWFDYGSITREEHTKLVGDFIVANPDLFQDGDIFSSCPECENGGPGDPRQTGDAPEYRKFLIQEYQTAKSAFGKIGKLVAANYFSMNGDVARLIMDKKTTADLDGIVVIDHYVKEPETLVKDAEDIAAQSGGKVVLGEFGAPIPDIHGAMTPEEQAQWIKQTLLLSAKSKNIIGVNYWVNVGGSTELWDGNGKQSPGAEIIQEFYKPSIAYGAVTDILDRPIAGAEIFNSVQTVFTDKNGYFEMPVVKSLNMTFNISASGFKTEDNVAYETGQLINIVLAKDKEDILDRIRLFFQKM